MYLRINELYETAKPVGRSLQNVEMTARDDRLRHLFHEQRGAFSSAARLLVGSQGARIVGEIVDSLQHAEPLSGRALFAIRRLLGILSLEHVHDHDGPDAALFASIDPTVPVVEDICLLADALRDAIEYADAAPARASCSGLSCTNA